jgi:UDP-glucose 4-epimerase
MNARVLVTGAAGFVGVPTIRALLDHGFEVVVLDNFSVGNPARLEGLGEPDRLEVHRVDLRDFDAVAEAVASARPWGVVHLAAIHFIPYCVAHPRETLAVNVLGLQHLLDALDDSAVRRFLFASSAAVYAPSLQPHDENDPTEPMDVYGASKLVGEQLVRLWSERCNGREAVIARLFNVVGPGETNAHVLSDIVRSLREGDEVRLGNVSSRRDYIHVNDVASVLVQLLTSNAAGIVNVGTGLSWSVSDLVENLRVISDRDLFITIDPAKVRHSDRPNLQASTARLLRILPGLSLTSLDDGLRDLLAEQALYQPVVTMG